jgi:hypothetical protein
MSRPVVRLLTILLALLAWSLRAGPVSAQAPGSKVSILSPQAGGVLQGQVTITGNNNGSRLRYRNITGFVSAEISFAYTHDPTDTWFLIASSTQPVTQGTLAVWDTTTITDGLYALRLRVTLGDGSYVDAIVPDLRVRNYTPVETNTPTAVLLESTPVPNATATATPYPTPTALPPNPAALTPLNIYTSLGYGALSVVVIIVLFAFYLRLRNR